MWMPDYSGETTVTMLWTTSFQNMDPIRVVSALLQIFEIVLITFLPDTVKVEDTMKPSYS
jgi:hypothetical protein